MSLIQNYDDDNRQSIVYKDTLLKLKLALILLKEEKYKFNIMFQNEIISFSCSLMEYLYQPSIETQYLYCMLNGEITKQFLNQAPLEIQEYILNYYPYHIKLIENPSLNLQWVAIKADPFAIEYIKTPSEDIKAYVVKRNGFCIQYIKNPSEEIQILAIEKNIFAFNYIKNPTLKVKELVYEKFLKNLL